MTRQLLLVNNRRGVLGLVGLLVILAVQYTSVVREEDLAVLSSSLPAGKMNDDDCSQASHFDKPIILDFKENKANY